MTPLTKKPKVGDVVRRIGDAPSYLTVGKEYMILGYDDDGDAYFEDDYGRDEFVSSLSFGNYELVEGHDVDPGYIEVHTELSPGLDDDELFAIEVTVDLRVYNLLLELEEKHDRATARRSIKAKIAELEEELKKI